MTFEPSAPAAGVRLFASVDSLADIHAALRDRFEALEISRAEIDAAAGLADGYASKLLAAPPIKHFGLMSLFPTLEIAGLRLALIEDPEAAARSAKLKKRVRHKVRCQPAGSARMVAATRPTVLRELGAKGGNARMAKLSPDGRRQLASRAATARWSKERTRA